MYPVEEATIIIDIESNILNTVLELQLVNESSPKFPSRLLESVNAQWTGFKDYAASGGNPPEDEWKQCPTDYQV